MRLGRSIAAGAGGAALTLTGAFLGLSPWMAGFAKNGQAWSLATKTDFWSGLGLVVVGLATVLLYRVELSQGLAARGITSRTPHLEAEGPVPVASAAPEPMTDAALLALASEVVREVQHEHGGEAASLPVDAAAAGVDEAELVRLATTLLHEIQSEKPEAEAAPSAPAEPEKPLALMSEAELARMASNLLEEIQRTQQSQWVPARKEDALE